MEDEEEDAEIIVNRVESLTDAVTLQILKNETEKDEQQKQLREDIRQGRQYSKQAGYKECYSELSVVEGLGTDWSSQPS